MSWAAHLRARLLGGFGQPKTSFWATPWFWPPSALHRSWFCCDFWITLSLLFLPDFPFATYCSDLLLLSSCLAEDLGSHGPVDLLQPLPEAHMGKRNYLVWIIPPACYVHHRDAQHTRGSSANLSGGISRTHPWTLVSLGSCPASDRQKQDEILN